MIAARLITAFALVLVGDTPPKEPDLGAVLQALQKPKTVKATFTQKKTLKTFTKPQLAHGRITISKPDKLRLEYLEPHQIVLVVNGARVSVSYPKLKKKQAFDRNQDPTMKAVFDTILFFIDADPKALKERFRVRYEPGKEPRLALTPVGGDSSMIPSIDVWIDLSQGTLTRIRLVQKDGGETDWRFGDVEIDRPVDDALFAP